MPETEQAAPDTEPRPSLFTHELAEEIIHWEEINTEVRRLENEISLLKERRSVTATRVGAIIAAEHQSKLSVWNVEGTMYYIDCSDEATAGRATISKLNYKEAHRNTERQVAPKIQS
jgi:hypothetical protein